MSKELGQRTDAELAALFDGMYVGWDRGVVVTQERHGNGDTVFPERAMTPLELAARYVAAEIGANIFEIANRAAFAPIITFSQIQARIGPIFDEMTSENERLRKALSAAAGYLMNAKIDLDTGAPKRTAVRTIEGGLKMVNEALANADPGSELASHNRSTGD